jgi:hypothetical protein
MADGRDPNLGKPLIRITTDLKSLKYTLVSDTTGKTLGKDPYVTKSIPNHRVESTIVNGVETSELVVDPTPPAADGIIQSRVDDLTRFRKLALEKQGQKFAINQAILGQNPLQIAKTAASILAQVPVNGTGTHFVNGFVVDTYLQKDAGQGTALGRFLATNLGINNLNGAGRALQGEQIITDNDGQKNYRSQSPSKLEERNSKYDKAPKSPLGSYYRSANITDDPFNQSEAASAFGAGEVKEGDIDGRNIVKGTPKGKNAKIIRDNPLSGSTGFDGFDGDSLQTRGFFSAKLKAQTPDEKYVRLEVSNLIKGTNEHKYPIVLPHQPAQADLFKLNFSNDGYAQYDEKYRLDNTFQRFPVSYSGSTGPDFPSYYRKAALVDQAQEGNIDGRTIVKGTPEGENAKIIRDNPLTNGQAFNDDYVQLVGLINADDQRRVDEQPTVKPNQFKDTVENPPSAGRIIASLGTEYDTAAEVFVTRTQDEEGNPLIIQGENVEPGTVPTTNLKYFQDDYEEYALEFDSKQISGPDGTGGRVTKLIDFRKIRKDSKLTNLFPYNVAEGENGYDSKSDISPIDYATQDIEVRLGMAGIGRQNYTDEVKFDYINSLGITSNDTIIPNTTDRPNPEYLTKDIIPFEIVTITPEDQTFLYFRAFLDDFSDNYSGEWNSNKFIGRGEDFYTYQGFKRDVSFSFKIAAFTSSELFPIYRKLNYLAATTAPTYNSEGSFMRGTLTEITIGDYLHRQEGFISKVGISWNKSYSWEIDLFGQKLPKVPTVLDVSINFTPIHRFNPTSIPNLRNGQELYIGNNLSQ